MFLSPTGVKHEAVLDIFESPACDARLYKSLPAAADCTGLFYIAVAWLRSTRGTIGMN